MKKLNTILAALLTLTVFSNSASASFGCRDAYQAKFARMEKHKTGRELAKVGLIFGLVLPAGVAGAVGGAVALQFFGMMFGGVGAASGGGMLVTEVIDREENLRNTYKIFNLAGLSRDEAFFQWQTSHEIRRFFANLPNNEQAFNEHLRLANETVLNGNAAWGVESFRAFCRNPVFLDPGNIFGGKYSNAIDFLMSKVGKKIKGSEYTYDDVRTEIAKISNDEACSEKRLMGFGTLKRTLIQSLSR